MPGDLVLPHQLLDYTHDRAATFFDGGDQKVVHVDFTHPYTPALRAAVSTRPRLEASRFAMAASTQRSRVRGWRPRQSTAWNATARRWSE